MFPCSWRVTCLLLLSFCGSLWNALCILCIPFLVASDQCTLHIYIYTYIYMIIYAYMYIIYIHIWYIYIYKCMNDIDIIYIYINTWFYIYIYIYIMFIYTYRSIHLRFERIVNTTALSGELLPPKKKCFQLTVPRGAVCISTKRSRIGLDLRLVTNLEERYNTPLFRTPVRQSPQPFDERNPFTTSWLKV